MTVESSPSLSPVTFPTDKELVLKVTEASLSPKRTEHAAQLSCVSSTV